MRPRTPTEPRSKPPVKLVLYAVPLGAAAGIMDHGAAARHVTRTDPTVHPIGHNYRRTWRIPLDVRVVSAAITQGAAVMLSVDDWRAVLLALAALGDDQDTVAHRILGQLPLDDLWWE